MKYDFSEFKKAIDKTLDWLSQEYSQIHTGRATPTVLDGIMVEAYGTKQPIKNIASVSIEDPKTLRISPWDKDQIKAIEKAIESSGLSLGTALDDQGLRVNFPDLSSERRQQLVKVLKDKAEDARVSLKLEREKVGEDINKMEKNKEISEDQKFQFREELQELVDKTQKDIDELLSKKENEILNK